MATMLTDKNETTAQAFHVVHPLDDVAEQKCSLDGLGEMPMNRRTKLSLYTLRGYLVTMGLLVAYRLLSMAGVPAHHAH